MHVCIRTTCCLIVQKVVITFVTLLSAMISFASNTNPHCLCIKMNNLLMLWERKPSVRAHFHILLYSPLRKKIYIFLNFWRLCLQHPRQISRPYFGNFGQERGWEMSSSCRMGGTQWGSFSGYVLDSWSLNRDGNCNHWGVCEPCGFLSPTPGGDQGGVFGHHSSSSS